MLARKAGYIRYGASRSVPGQRTRTGDKKFTRLLFQTVSILILFCFFLLTYVALSAIKTNYSYSLMQKKLHTQQLQRENEILRVDIAKLETPERIYTTAQKLGMVVPVTVLYGQSHERAGAENSSR